MDINNEFLINSGEIYIREYTNWQDNTDLRKYIEEMETLIRIHPTKQVLANSINIL